MENMENIKVEKPLDWPQNYREYRLSNILIAIERFQKDPNYGNREILVSLVTDADFNQYNARGMSRITLYEVCLVNELWTYARTMHLDTLQLFLYKVVVETTRNFNMILKMQKEVGIIENINDINYYNYLILPLKLFYISYRQFNYYKQHSFCEELLDIINNVELLIKQDEIKVDLEQTFTNLIFDLSCASGVNTIPFIEFDRKDLLKLFDKEFEILKKYNKNPLESPTKGILKMIISNWILRSRNNYNHSPVFKCLTNIASDNSIKNQEIWMQHIEYLNDKREGKVIKELFANKQWIQYNWAKKIKLDNPYSFYVTSFSKTKPNKLLKDKYGKNVYGYKSDRIANLVAPIINNNEFVQFGQTISYGIIYDRDLAKEELNFLFQIIGKLPLKDNQKTKFANEIISYWFLSFKDKRWKDENGRRYQIFYYEKYPYLFLDKDERFLKIKSSIFLYPDNISRDNNQFEIIKKNMHNKYFFYRNQRIYSM